MGALIERLAPSSRLDDKTDSEVLEGKRRSFETRAPLTSSDGAAREEIELGVERIRVENEAGSPESILASTSEKDSNTSRKEIAGYCKSL